MGCQHDIAEQIVRRGADYVLNVKGNLPNLAEAIQTWFDAADAGTLERPFWQHSQTDKNHGRIETRRCVATNDVAWLQQQEQHWPGLQSLAMVESSRAVIGRHGTSSVERRYYISSLPAKPAVLGKIVRAHWDALKTACTGYLMLPSARTRAEFVPAMRHTTCLSCAESP
ncbi:ISAs1 family transposase [Verminephrobacter eiseniae]|uniref:ISAs1 family transposase n=1 Tax=Verminephrobacter eiseniae TaxID=364317 RepID=UPI00223713AD|nr:ISAs1 family transposase [Verminephrobacter eiseniae]